MKKLKENKSLLIAVIAASVFLLLVLCTLIAWGVFTFLLYEKEETDETSEIEIISFDVAITSPTSRDWYQTNQTEILLGGIYGDSDGGKLTLIHNDVEIPLQTENGNWNANLSLSPGDNEIVVKNTNLITGKPNEDKIIILHQPELSEELKISKQYLEIGKSDEEVLFTVSFEETPTEGVFLYQVDGMGKTLESQRIEKMLDDGSERSGDKKAGDGIYSVKLLMKAEEEIPLHFRVGNANKGGVPTFYSKPTQLPVYPEPTQEQYDDMVNNSNLIEDEYNRFISVIEIEGDPYLEAAQYMEGWLREQDFISESGRSTQGTGVWWIYADTGIIGGITNNDEDEKSGEQSSSGLLNQFIPKVHALTPPNKLEVGSFNALYLGPYYSQFQPKDDWHFAFKEIKKSECPKYEYTEKKDDEVKVEDFRSLDRFGYIVISTHGDTWLDGKEKSQGGKVVLHTSQRLTFEDYIKYYPELKAQRLGARTRKKGLLLTVLPEYIERYNHSMPNSLVYVSACRSAYNNSLAKVFIGAGARAYYGYTDYVKVDYAYWTGGYMVRGFIHQDKNAQEAFEYGKKPRGEKDTSTPPAYFKRWGRDNLIEGEDPCCSGQCMSGSYSGMTTLGDSNPQNVGRGVEIFTQITIDDEGQATGSIEIVDPEYTVVLDPEHPNPLYMDTRSGEGSAQLTGSWNPEGGYRDYAPAFNGEDVAREVVSGNYYSIELSGDGSYTSRSDAGSNTQEVTIKASGAVGDEKMHLTITIDGEVLGRLWIYKE